MVAWLSTAPKGLNLLAVPPRPPVATMAYSGVGVTNAARSFSNGATTPARHNCAGVQSRNGAFTSGRISTLPGVNGEMLCASLSRLGFGIMMLLGWHTPPKTSEGKGTSGDEVYS